MRGAVAFLSLLLLATPLSAQAAPAELPDSPAGTVLRAWLSAVNSADTARIRAYVIRHEAEDPADPRSVQESFSNVQNVSERTHGLTVVDWKQPRPERIEVTVQDAGGRKLAMFMEVTQVAGDWRVIDIGLRPMAAGS